MEIAAVDLALNFVLENASIGQIDELIFRVDYRDAINAINTLRRATNGETARLRVNKLRMGCKTLIWRMLMGEYTESMSRAT